MLTSNVDPILYTNTFDVWLQNTNKLIAGANTLYFGNFYKTLGNVGIQGSLSIQGPTSKLTVANDATVSGVLTAGNLYLSDSPGVSVPNRILAAAAAAAQTASVSANSGSILTAQHINFVNTSTVIVSVTPGTSGNANVAFTTSLAAGAQGIQGNRGSQGTQGTQGTRGLQGTQGNGVQGSQGVIGPQGASGGGGGGSGIQGIQGTLGYVGSTGAQGTQGIQGISGGTGYSNSWGSTGHIIMPNGMIINWGYSYIPTWSGSGLATIYFDSAFPNACYGVFVASNRNSKGSLGANHVYAVSTSSAQIVADSQYAYWIAIGY